MRNNEESIKKLTALTIPCKLIINLLITSTVELANGDKIYLRSFPSNKINEFLQFVNDNDLVDDGG
jgi:hypothetical protein